MRMTSVCAMCSNYRNDNRKGGRNSFRVQWMSWVLDSHRKSDTGKYYVKKGRHWHHAQDAMLQLNIIARMQATGSNSITFEWCSGPAKKQCRQSFNLSEFTLLIPPNFIHRFRWIDNTSTENRELDAEKKQNIVRTSKSCECKWSNLWIIPFNVCYASRRNYFKLDWFVYAAAPWAHDFGSASMRNNRKTIGEKHSCEMKALDTNSFLVWFGLV